MAGRFEKEKKQTKHKTVLVYSSAQFSGVTAEARETLGETARDLWTPSLG